MAMKKVLCVSLVSIACLLLPTQAFADAQSCINDALRATKANIGNEHELDKLFDHYFGEAFARFPVRRGWDQMQKKERDEQISYARDFVVSEATNLAKYANADIKFTADPTHPRVFVGFYNGEKGPTKITVIMGSPCHFMDIQVAGYPNLLESITDVRRLIHSK
jgi:hypothetical protein